MGLAGYASGLARVEHQCPGTARGGIEIAVPTTRPAGQTEESWPTECLESAPRFGHADALLYPLIGAQVRTPKGIAVLRQVLGGRAVVDFEGAQCLARFHVEEVRPLDMRVGGNQP